MIPKTVKHFLLLALKFKNRHRQLLKKHYSDHNNLHSQFHLACTHFSNYEQEKKNGQQDRIAILNI